MSVTPMTALNKKFAGYAPGWTQLLLRRLSKRTWGDKGAGAMVVGKTEGPYLQQDTEGRHGALVVIQLEHALHAQRCGRHAVEGLHEGALVRVLAAGSAVHGQAHR